MRQENNRWLGWKWITQNICTLMMEDKMAAEAFLGALGIKSDMAPLSN